MRERDQPDRKGLEIDAAVVRDDVELDLTFEPLLLQFLGNDARREPVGIDRHLEIGREIRDGADMILMRVGEDDADEVLAAFLDEGGVGHDDVDAWIIGIPEGHAQIDHQPFAIAPVQVAVHADFARPAKCEEEQFFTWSCHSFLSGVGGSTAAPLPQ